MLRRGIAALAVVVAAALMSGCMEFEYVEGARTGDRQVTLTAGICDPSCFGRQEWGTSVQYLLGLEIPADATAPGSFTSDGLTLTRSSSFENELATKDPAGPGRTWVGYLSETVPSPEVESLEKYRLSIDIGLPEDGSLPLAYRTTIGKRGGSAITADGTVTCGTPLTQDWADTTRGGGGQCVADSAEGEIDDDTTPPDIDIYTPEDGRKYDENAEVYAAYVCQGAKHGGCVGTVPDGELVDTDPSTGTTKTFKVTATDAAGNTAEKTVQYGVRGPIVVNTTADTDGTCTEESCSLREAINAARDDPRFDHISFDIPGPGPHVIKLESALPLISEVSIDGYSQPGSKANTATTGSNADIRIALEGTLAIRSMPLVHGTIRGVALYGFGTGIELLPGARITGSFIGLTADGTGAPGNATGVVANGADSEGNRPVVGGVDPADRNVISGNATGVDAAVGARVIGNLIGTNPAGDAPLGAPGTGVRAFANGVKVGLPGAGNVITGFRGILVAGSGAPSIQGNRIGVSAAGQPLGAPTTGVDIASAVNGTVVGRTSELLGDDTEGNVIRAATGVKIAGTGNRVAGNTLRGTGDPGHGVSIVSGTGNTIRRNTISGFAGRGIDLGGPANDDGDADGGPNGLQNHPFFYSVNRNASAPNRVMALIGFQPAPGISYAIDVYAGDKAGDADRLVKSFQPGDGATAFGIDEVRPEGTTLTATATNLTTGETSELSPAAFMPRPPTITSVANSGPVAEDVAATVTVAADATENDEITYAFDCGDDGTYETGPQTVPSASCVYSSPGTKTVRVKAIDLDGASIRTTSIAVEDVPPTVDLSGPSAADEGTTKTFTYTAGPADAAVTESCGEGATKIDTAASGSFDCTFPDGPRTSTVSVGATDDGVTQTDTIAVSVANVVPTVAVSGPATANEGNTKTYTYTVSDPGDDAAPTIVESCGAGNTRIDTDAVRSFDCRFSDGPSTPAVRVTATDEDGGAGTAAQDVAVANVGPVVDVSGSATADEGQTKTYTYTITDPGDDADNVVSEGCGGGRKTDTPAPNSFDCTFTDGDATRTLGVLVLDDGTFYGDSIDVTVANVAPTVDLTGPTSVGEGQTKTYSYTITDPGDDATPTVTETCPSIATKVDTDAPRSFDCTFPDGPATGDVKVEVVDEGLSASDAVGVAVSNVAPTVDLSGSASVDEGQTKTYTYTVTDPGDDPSPVVTESCGTGATKTDTEQANSFTCTFPDGPASPSVSVSAAEGGSTGTDTIDVTVANVAPAVVLTGAVKAAEGQTRAYAYTVSDPGSDPAPTITESCGTGARKDPTGIADSFQCTFLDGPATPEVSVSARDEDGATGTGKQTVEVANIAPVVDLNGPATADEGDTATYTYSVSDSGDDAAATVTESCGAGATKTDTEAAQSFECTFTDGAATGSVSVSIDDEGAVGTDTISVTVANVAPTVKLSGPAAAGEGQTKTYTYSVSDPGDDAAAQVAESCGTAGTLVDTAAAKSFDCTFPAGPASSTVGVRVEDEGTAVSDAIAVTVSDLPAVLSLSGADTAAEGQTKTYTWQLSDPGGDPLPEVTESCGDGAALIHTLAERSFDCRFYDGPATSTVAVSGGGVGDDVSVAVTNVVPSCAADAYSVDEDAVLTTRAPGVLANDTDPGEDELTAGLERGPAHGTVTLDEDGGFAYRPAADFNGEDSFTYRASDGAAASEPVTVTLAVASVDDPVDPKNDDAKKDDPKKDQAKKKDEAPKPPVVGPRTELPLGFGTGNGGTVPLTGVSGVAGDGTFTAKLGNPNPFAMSIRLTTFVGSAGGARAAAVTRIGSGAGRFAPFESKVLKLKLNRAGRRMLRRTGRVRVTTTLKLRDPQLVVRTVKGRSMTLRLKRP